VAAGGRGRVGRKAGLIGTWYFDEISEIESRGRSRRRNLGRVGEVGCLWLRSSVDGFGICGVGHPGG
jgi:hypothetical protein